MRNNNLWDIPQEQLPVYGTIASQFNDPGMNQLYKSIMDELVKKADSKLISNYKISEEMSEKIFVIPPARVRYLSEISENNRNYDAKVLTQVEVAQKLFGIYKTITTVLETTSNQLHLIKNGLNEEELKNASIGEENKTLLELLLKEFDRVKMDFDPYNWEVIVP